MTDNSIEYEVEQPATEDEKSLVILSNHIARKCSRWSMYEAKIFFMALSEIDNINLSDGSIVLKKNEVFNFLEIKNTKARHKVLREAVEHLLESSWIQMGDEEFRAGYLVYHTEVVNNAVKIWFAMPFLPILKDLSGNFSTFYLEQIQHFKSKFSLQLFMYLRSRWNGNYLINTVKIPTAELFRIFGLNIGEDYTDKSGHFNRYNFETKTLKRAIAEINSTPCLLKVAGYTRTKDWRGNVYYEIKYSRLTSDGRYLDNATAEGDGYGMD